VFDALVQSMPEGMTLRIHSCLHACVCKLMKTDEPNPTHFTQPPLPVPPALLCAVSPSGSYFRLAMGCGSSSNAPISTSPKGVGDATCQVAPATTADKRSPADQPANKSAHAPTPVTNAARPAPAAKPATATVTVKSELADGPDINFSFEMLDTDRNGKLSFAEYKAGFQILDTDKDGFISRKEFDCDGRVTHAEYNKGFDLLDVNKDGFISQMEFNCVCSLPFKLLDKDGDGMISREEWNNGFQVFDLDGDCSITKSEFHIVSGNGFVFELLDTDGDGQITQKEYTAGFDILDSDHDGFLSRFKLIRLRRISLATLRRDGWRDGRRDGCQYMYCLPPAGGRIRSQGNKMRHRRNQRKLMRLKPKGFIESSTLGAIMNGRRYGWIGGRRVRVRGVYGFSSLVKQNKKGKNCAVFCFAGKKKLLFYILRCDCEAKNL
jgi:Ca2+-binding EF-hand superfamily protein